MLFNSYAFIFLVSGSFILYYQKFLSEYQILILIISSFIFYGYSQPYLLLLLFASASTNAITSYIVYNTVKRGAKKFWAITGVLFNLGVLAFFKYNRLLYDLLPGSLSHADELFNLALTIPLPIGISFYTFQGISLVSDVYQEESKKNIYVDKNFFRHYRNTLFFTAFFPQLICGPIVKAQNFFPQIKKKFLNEIDVDLVFKSLITGYFLKSVIADNLKDQTFWIAYPYFQFKSSLTLVTMLFGYSMQIFADFAGYSLIAIGVAAIFGYKLPANFNFPYISSSVAEFWRRWHISLSSWLKEYLYFNLGGNRKGNLRTYFNLIIVMFLGGLWHGAALSYGIWGLWHGAGLIIERYFVKKRKFLFLNRIPMIKPLKILAVFLFVSFGWLLFKLTNFSEALSYIVSIGQNIHLNQELGTIFIIFVYSVPILLYHLLHLTKFNSRKTFKIIKNYDYLIYACMLFLLLINGGNPSEFVYFQF